MTDRFLSPHQIALLSAVQDELIPDEDGMPSAGSIGGARTVEAFLREQVELYELIVVALDAIETAADNLPFQHRSSEERVNILKHAEIAAPEAFAELVRQTYNAYYTQPEIQAKLGVDHAPQPSGFELASFDPSRLARVRAMGKLWRDA